MITLNIQIVITGASITSPNRIPSHLEFEYSHLKIISSYFKYICLQRTVNTTIYT